LYCCVSEKVKRQSYKEDDGKEHNNIAAIVCRVSPSFYRVGHLELLSLFKYIIRIEYSHLKGNIKSLVIDFLQEASHKFAKLVSKWQSVGYIQSNMNSDNASIGGRTIDYGPFGFMGV